MSLINKKIFQKFDGKLDRPMLPFSPSKMNSWRDKPAEFVIKYIYGYPFAGNCAMERGNAVQYGVEFFLTDKKLLLDCIQKAEEYYDLQPEVIMADEEERNKQRKMISKMITNCYEHLKKLSNLKYFYPNDTADKRERHRIDTNIGGVPFYGYTDITLENDEEITLIELKSTGRFEYRYGYKIQTAIYKKALEETFKKKVNAKVLVVSPAQAKLFELEDEETLMKEIEFNLISCANIFQQCKSIDDFKSVIVPKLDDWWWNNEHIIKARSEIWGI